jgi:hypothetical protein
LKKIKEEIQKYQEGTEAFGVSCITGIYDHHFLKKEMEVVKFSIPGCRAIDM